MKTISSMESILALRGTNKHRCVSPDMDCLAIGVEVVGEGSTETRLVSTSEIRKTVMLRACYYCSEMVKKESFQCVIAVCGSYKSLSSEAVNQDL